MIGAHAFVLGDTAGDKENITGSAYTPLSTTTTSLTTELYGILSITIFMYVLQQYYQLQGKQ